MILTRGKITNRTRQILDSLQEGFSRIPFTGKRDRLKLQLKPQATQAQHENLMIKGAVSRNSAKLGYCKMPVKLKEA